MITEKLIKATANFILSCITTAEITVDGVVEQVAIIHKEVQDNLIKIHTQTGNGSGTIESIRLKNADGDVLMEKAHNVERSNRYSLVTKFALRLEERMLTAEEVLNG
ncbi:MAG: hypothetical protein GXZ11_05585 [Tissierellia bacterium]|nr:hypothetical protein [Tissierellia bacterium]